MERQPSSIHQRQEIVLEILKGEKGRCTQKSIQKTLEDKGYSCAQGTISADIKAVGYIRKDGRYILQEAADIKDKKDLIKRLLAADEPIVRGPFLIPEVDISTSQEPKITSVGVKKPKNEADNAPGLYMITVRVRNGFEEVLGQLIYYVYKKMIQGVIPGCGCISVYIRSPRNAIIVRDGLKKLTPKGIDGSIEE